MRHQRMSADRSRDRRLWRSRRCRSPRTIRSRCSRWRRTSSISGVVTEWKWQNPHVHFTCMVKPGAGRRPEDGRHVGRRGRLGQHHDAPGLDPRQLQGRRSHQPRRTSDEGRVEGHLALLCDSPGRHAAVPRHRAAERRCEEIAAMAFFQQSAEQRVHRLVSRIRLHLDLSDGADAAHRRHGHPRRARASSSTCGCCRSRELSLCSACSRSTGSSGSASRSTSSADWCCSSPKRPTASSIPCST